MKNKTTTYKWAYLPFVFSSAAILATQATAGPSGSQRYQDAKQVNSINHEYVGGDHSIGLGVDDDGNVDAEFNAAISRSENHRTGVGLWAGYDLDGDDKGILGRGGEVNHAWVSRDATGRATHVNKTFAAYDRNEAGNDKATVGYGQENEHLFWDGRVSKGLGGGTNARSDGRGNIITDRAYDWGVGASVGKYLPNANARIRAGIDHEWSDKVGSNEKDARNTTLSAGIEKFFQGTGHSVSLDVAGSKNSGGSRVGRDDDTDVTGRLGYKYDFGGSSIYQPDRRYRRVRVEVPGQAVAPRYAQKQQYKKIPTYKTVPVYGNKSIRTPYKQLVKSTMELEGQTFFKLNSSKLIPSAQTRLKQIAAQIRKTGYKGSIRITGNTCGLGNARYDQILSEKRAKEVRSFLIKNGFNPNHLIARGLGKNHPKYARTPDQDFKNRRVDIEYVSQQQTQKTAYKTENKRVQTGTRRVATGFKNVPAGMKNVMISNGRPGSPRVIWKTEAIPTSPAWIQRALNNNIKHDRNVNTYTTTFGNEGDDVKAANDTATTNAGQSVLIDVLANDDSDATITRIIRDPSNGTATIVNGQVRYTPNAGFTGTDSFDYEVRDPEGNLATATATITVIAVNTVPDAVNDVETTDLNTAVSIDVLGNDTDPENDALTITSFTQGTNGTVTRGANGQLVYTPNTGFIGTDSFTYTISDGNGGTDTATVNVTVGDDGNTKPDAVNDSDSTDLNTAVSIDVLGNDTDPENDTLTVIRFTQGVKGTVTRGANGQLVYTPNTGFIGTDSFTYTISDGNGGTDTATVNVTVGDVKKKLPVANDDVEATACGVLTIDVLDNDSGDNLSLFSVDAGSQLYGTVIQSGNQIIYTPSSTCGKDNIGVDTFSYTIKDGNGNTDSANVEVTVKGLTVGGSSINAQMDTEVINSGETVTMHVLRNDTGNGLKVIGVAYAPNGTTSYTDSTVTYTATGTGTYTETFGYDIIDANGYLDYAIIMIDVVKGCIKGTKCN